RSRAEQQHLPDDVPGPGHPRRRRTHHGFLTRQGFSMRPRPTLQTALLAVVAAGLAAGCGGPHPYPVSGQVVYDDGEVATDLVGSDVIFTSDELKVSSSGEIDGNGRYTLTMKRKEDGALPGRYKVVIVPPDPRGADDPR